MSAPLSTERRGLKAFRLSEVDLDLRTRAASRLARNAGVFEDGDAPADRLFARLRANMSAAADSTDPEVFKRVAREPSDRLYWIPRAAWERVMGRADTS